MSGLDREQFNTLERALSADINDLQSVKDRVIQEALRFLFEQRAVSSNTVGGRTDRSVVLGGLNAIPGGASDVSIGPGMLAQFSAGLAPAPGAFDSSYRVGRLQVASLVALPSPGVETWYLVEAQMVETITETANRDIFNPGTQTFVPALVDKKAERRLQFQVVAGAGSNYPAPTGGDWVPICGVKRPAGGPAVVASDIDDMRPLWALKRFESPGNAVGFPLRPSGITTTHDPGGAVSNIATLSAERWFLGNYLAFAGVHTLTNVEFVDPTTVFAADTWYYLYLLPWQGIPLAGYYANSIYSRGLLVVSHIDPSTPLPDGNSLNQAVLNLPTPFGVTTAAFGTAVCVAALQRNSANTGWTSTKPLGGGFHGIEAFQLASFSPPIVGPNTVTLTAKVPLNANSWRIRFIISGTLGDTPVSAALLVRKTGGLAAWYQHTFDAASSDTFYLDIPAQMFGGTSFEIDIVAAAPTTLVASLVGAHY